MDTFFFWCAKLIWAIVSPDHLLIIALTITCSFFWLGFYQLARRMFATLMAAIWLIVFFPVGSVLLAPLETRFPVNPLAPDHIDGIIMLGGNEKIDASMAWQQVELNAYTERALAFMHLAKQYPDAILVFAGGSGSLKEKDIAEADIAARLFQQQGLDISKIHFERHSRNTHENALLAKAIANPKVGQHWLLITSASHMPRAVGVFCQNDWPVMAYPVDHWTVPSSGLTIDFAFIEHMEQLVYGVREWLGLMAYYFSGKTNALLPQACIKN